MSEAQTNPQGEVDTPQLNMFDVMFGSEKDTNPEQAIEKPEDTAQSEAELVSQLQGETEEAEEAAEELEAVDEDQSEDEVEEVEDEIADSETESVYTVKLDGEEHEVTLEELRNGYQRQADYTRKSQSLAEQRKAYEANLEAVQSERGQYAEALDVLSKSQETELAQFHNMDWKSLKEDDPVEYMEKRIEFQDSKDRITILKQEQARVQQQQQKEMAEVVSEKLKVEGSKLAEKLPEYADPSSTVRNDIREYTLGMGFSPEDVDGITDHRVVLVLHKAMMADKGIKTASTKKSKTVPKVVKAGTPKTKAQKTRKSVQAKRERLSKTGNQRDAASVFLDLLES
tara:strand:+ start:1781 stop:2806 length:1026 start_codon:yes stop_codon:yes gene_type:complete